MKKALLKKAFTSLQDLTELSLLSEERAGTLTAVAAKYSVSLTKEMADLIDPANVNDPIALQFIPNPNEIDQKPHEIEDPNCDEQYSPVKGIVHRYPDRVLFKALHSCAVYCRYCFRREQVGRGKEVLRPDEMEEALNYVRQTPQIWEVILTGGDPLMLSPRKLGHLLTELDKIPHVKNIRIHTRVPIVRPDLISDEVLTVMKSIETALWVVIHSNHAREFSANVSAGLRKLSSAGIPLLCQSVLLKGINDNAETLDALFRTLIENRVKPYYLHHPDKAPGTSHFYVTIEQGQAIMAKVGQALSGIAKPTYCMDIPGGHGKVSISKNYVQKKTDTEYMITTLKGDEVSYYSPVVK